MSQQLQPEDATGQKPADDNIIRFYVNQEHICRFMNICVGPVGTSWKPCKR